VDGAEVRVLKEADQVGLAGLLEGEDGRWSRSDAAYDISFVILYTKYPKRRRNDSITRGCLEGVDGGGLEAEFILQVLGDLADEALEGQPADQELGRLLVLADLAQGDGARPVAVGLLDAAGGRGGFARGLRARKVSGWPKRRELAHVFLCEYSYKRLELAQLLGQLGIFLTLVASCLRGALPPVLLRAVCLVRAMAPACLINSGYDVR
jgi:hypothetical protein